MRKQNVQTWRRYGLQQRDIKPRFRRRAARPRKHAGRTRKHGIAWGERSAKPMHTTSDPWQEMVARHDSLRCRAANDVGRQGRTASQTPVQPRVDTCKPYHPGDTRATEEKNRHSKPGQKKQEKATPLPNEGRGRATIHYPIFTSSIIAGRRSRTKVGTLPHQTN